MKVYFDNAATTKVCPEAAQAALKAMTEEYGNPSSTHAMGRSAKMLLEASRKTIATAVGAKPEEIFFTSGGTESDNWAVMSACEKMRRGGKKIVISGYEHDAINRPCAKLEEMGWKVTAVPPEKNGKIDPDRVLSAVEEDTALVSVMLVNNEVGAINPIKDIAKGVMKKSGALIHTDAVQGFCKMPVSVKSLGVDLMSLSSHKIHGPKGCGALFVKSGLKLPPFMLGGGQEDGLRSGTEALPAISGFAAAAKIGTDQMPQSIENMRNIRNFLADTIVDNIQGSVLIGEGDAPHILSISLPGYKSEVIMNFLDREGIFISKSSACKKGKRSHVLEAMGLAPEIIDGALRISLSKFSTIEEAEYFAETLKMATQKVLKVL